MRRLAYLAAVVGCGLFYLTFGRWLLWMLLLGLLALPVVSLALSIPAIRSIRLGVAGPDRVKVGEKAELLLMGSCDMPMPPFRGRLILRDLRTGEKHPYREETGFLPQNCGGYAVEIEKGKVLDYLGLFSFPVRKKRNGQLLVLPAKCPLETQPEELDLPPLRWKPSTQRLGENHEPRRGP